MIAQNKKQPISIIAFSESEPSLDRAKFLISEFCLNVNFENGMPFKDCEYISEHLSWEKIYNTYTCEDSLYHYTIVETDLI